VYTVHYTLLYESYGMQISDVFGPHFHVWRHQSS